MEHCPNDSGSNRLGDSEPVHHVPMKRRALDKETFMSGNRQRWTAVFILCMFAVLILDCRYDVDPKDYLFFLTVLAPVVVGSLTVSSWNKEHAEMKK